MPKLTDVLHYKKPITKFTNYRLMPLKTSKLPAVLKDQVSCKGENRKTKQCLQEMSRMLVCLQKNEFVENQCKKEIEEFGKCQAKFQAEAAAKKAAEAKGIMSSTTGRLSSTQVNALLGQYPQPKS